MSTKPTTEAKQIFLDLLTSKPNKKIYMSELKKHLFEKASQIMSDGNIAGALYSLSHSTKAGVKNVDRGVYVYIPTVNVIDELTHDIQEIINDSLLKMKKASKNIDLYKISPNDLPKLENYKELVDYLEKFLESLVENKDNKKS